MFFQDMNKTEANGGETQTTTLSSSAENKQNSIKEKSEISKNSKTDPWSLELFEDISRKPKYETDKTLPLDNTSTPVDTARNTGLLITDKGKIHVLTKSKSNTNLRHRFQRSMSVLNVPTQMNLKSRVKLLNTRLAGGNRRRSTFAPIEYASDFYVYSLLWACGVMIIWKNLMLLPILTIPVLIYLVKHFGIWLGLWDRLYQYYDQASSFLMGWCCERIDAFIPVPIRGLYKVTQFVNQSLKIYIKDSIDTVASSVVILGLMIFVVCASIFIALQVSISFYAYNFYIM